MKNTFPIGRALEAAAAKLTQIASGVPELRYSHVYSSFPLTRHMLASWLPVFDGLNPRVNQMPQRNGQVEFSCYFGDFNHQLGFEAIAAPTLGLVNRVLTALGELQVFDSWFEFVRCGHNRFPDDHLTTIDRTSYEVWHIREKAPYVVCLSECSDPESLNDYQDEHGPPDARFEIVVPRFDPFTALGAVIDHFLTDYRKLEKNGTPVGLSALEALVSVDDIDVSALGTIVTDATIQERQEAEKDAKQVGSRRRAGAKPPRPEWVNDSLLIGPATMKVISELVGLGNKQVLRLIDHGKLWRQDGASPGRYYFQHRDFATNQKVLSDFEASKSKKAKGTNKRNRLVDSSMPRPS